MGFPTPPGSGGALLTGFSYRLQSDGTTVTAYNKSGSVVASGSDGGAVLQSVFTDMPAAGCSITFRNDGSPYPWATTPSLPQSISERLVIYGEGSTVTLSATAPTFLKPGRIADFDTIKNVEISDFVIDRNDVVIANAGSAVVLGSGLQSQTQRLNWANICIRKIRTLNVPTFAGTSFIVVNLDIISYHVNAGEGTQTSIQNVLVEDCDFTNGGNYGVRIGGLCVNANHCNVYVDTVEVQRVHHDTGVLNATGSLRGDVGVHIGAGGFGGTATVRDCTSNRSGDPGFEFDAIRTLLVENCYSTDARSCGFLLANFQDSDDPAAQIAVLRDCHSRIVNYDVTLNALNTGFILGNGSDYGTIKLKDCSVHTKQTALNTTADTQGWAAWCTSSVARIVVDGFEMVMDNVTNSSSGGLRFVYGLFLWPKSDCEISLKRIRISRAGTIGTSIRERLITLGATAPGFTPTIGLEVDGITYSIAQTGGTTGATLWLFVLDNSAQIYNLRDALIQRLSVKAYSASDATPVGLLVGSQGSVTVQGQIRGSDLDFYKLNGLNGVTFSTSGGASNAAQTSIVGQVQNIYPIAKVAITPSGSPFVWQNVLGYPAKLLVNGGTVTDVSWSQDGATYASIATASPVGPVMMDSGDYIKVTYAVAPTMSAYQAK